MPNVVDNLAEGNTGYLLINYNLDTQNAVFTHQVFREAYVYKNAEILKLTGTSASKIYDNGTGTDLANNSGNVALSYNLNLTAVKNGYLFVEAAKPSKDKMNLNYQQGWLNTATTTTKTALDNAVIDQDIPYFTSMRVPAVAVGDYVYVNETNPTATETRVYNVYKLPLNAPTASKTSVTPTLAACTLNALHSVPMVFMKAMYCYGINAPIRQRIQLTQSVALSMPPRANSWVTSRI